MCSSWRFLRAAVVTCGLPLSLLAQRDKPPRRPALAAGADTNDARAYYDFAIAVLDRDPGKAADALYWSARLDPGSADALYARRIALLLTDQNRLVRYWDGDRRTVQSDDIRRVDSLYYFALTLDPFVSRQLDQHLLQSVMNTLALQADQNGEATRGEAEFYMNQYLTRAPAAMRAWIAYDQGRYAEALDLYAKAVHDAKKSEKSAVRMDRGRLLMQMGRADSALAELEAADQEIRDVDKKDLVFVYQSKALLEHAIAVVQRRLGHPDAARDALGRALEEDLSYYPAHMELGYIALDAHDTATALSEMDLATQLAGDDAGVRYAYGFTLASAGKSGDAETQLRKAIALNPVFASPHFVLAQTLDTAQRATDAAAEYRAFLATAARADPRRARAESRLAAIGGGA